MPRSPSHGMTAAPRTHTYHRHTPERSWLYRLDQALLVTWSGLRKDGTEVPAHLARELRGFRECGILAPGFARAYAWSAVTTSWSRSLASTPERLIPWDVRIGEAAVEVMTRLLQRHKTPDVVCNDKLYGG